MSGSHGLEESLEQELDGLVVFGVVAEVRIDGVGFLGEEGPEKGGFKGCRVDCETLGSESVG